MTLTYAHTRRACYTGYITQAIVNNLAPLLFIVFQTDYDLSYNLLGSLVLINFFTQLVVDALAARFMDALGYRRPLVAAHILAAAGLIMLSVLPRVLPHAYVGLICSVVVYAIGGGLLEVLVSPVVDALPNPQERKAASMSLLHSFYCWGQAAVVLFSTLLLRAVGMGKWWILPVIWAVIPLANLFLFLNVPLPATLPEEARTPLRKLLRQPGFIAVLLLMMCAGSSELTVSQWSPLFAELGLGLEKMWGDLAGPFLFAVTMGIGRTFHGVMGNKLKLTPFMLSCAALCVVCYLTMALSPTPMASLISCAVSGFSVSVMWPGTFSLASSKFPSGGTAMFAMLALFGDLGGAAGPWLSGVVADNAEASGWLEGISGLKTGILSGVIFPAIIVILMVFEIKRKADGKK